MRLYFGNTREPFALAFGHRAYYIITSARDVTEVHKSAASLTFATIRVRRCPNSTFRREALR
ncbi:uncharacterized protein BDZ99DRAFT_461385 [Mytilinidion resinicola]|uniref:Uncharacterized protein n=1 Tax=Mytilinidion resinicola TaxID=574789 RepID=A0A6A6YXU3_9PEZI|nr:uncharacterized protein BDZ99DRAFT_461385 [Mytilinidion resinicola]KAF2812745.1 hypothetical protein BDZ99DRAFT_461385 [Mytilinidion resinicola]